LFPTVAAASRRGAVSREAIRSAAERKGIGHHDYVDRYFIFGIPDDDIPDADLRRMLTGLRNGEQDGTLVLHLIADTERTLRKISMRRPRDEATSAAIIELIGEHFASLSDSHDAGGPSQRQLAGRLAEELLAELPNGVADVLPRLDSSLGSMVFATRLLLQTRQNSRELLAGHSTRIQTVLERYGAKPFPEAPADVLSLIFNWKQADPQRCRDWLRGQVQAGRWDGLDIVGWRLSTVADNGQVRLEPRDVEAIEALLGITYLFDRYESELNSLPQLDRHLASTPEDRRLRALHALKVLRADRSGSVP